ncbi:MAG: hypothetical protein ACOY93_20470 [Bacillota bacterium]
MNNLNIKTLAALGARVAFLGSGGYALPVRFRIRGGAVECRVPTWTGIGDLLEEPVDLLLVAVDDTGAHLRWLFLRGPAAVVQEPDWEGLEPNPVDRVSREDLYQLIRLQPRRIEWVDEERGWGVRETLDL